MSIADSETRIAGKCHSIDYRKTQTFFDSRANKSGQTSLTATMYQNADLAARRDEFEKRKILSLLNLQQQDRVLDLGCGTGRWARAIAPLVENYLGLDFSDNLLTTASKEVPGAVFQQMAVNALEPSELRIPPPFTLIVCSGILAYVNDLDLSRLFGTLSEIAAADSRIYVREPVAKAARLTLDEFWSEELESCYSAIYRTRGEYMQFFRTLSGFQLVVETQPFPSELQNRAETEQCCFVLERRSRW